VIRVREILLLLLLLLTAGCGDYEEKSREVGYKGKARLNPWLAAERLCTKLGYHVDSRTTWKNPEWEDAVCFMPAELLNNQGFIDRMEQWVGNGGHLVILCDYSQVEWNDWSEFHHPDTRIAKPLKEYLGGFGIELDNSSGREPDSGQNVSNVEFGGRSYEVDANSGLRLEGEDGGYKDIFVSKNDGYGRLSVVTDARIFRNRGIDQNDRTSFLLALINADDREGNILFVRGSGVSLLEMLRKHLWPLLAGLGVMLVFWLWKSMARFGPLEAASVSSPLRGYDHHLEALGDYQWRLDKCLSLLAPLREQIVELGQQQAVRSGRRDSDFFGFLAERAGVPRERVVRALSEIAPADPAVLTRSAGDLQLVIRTLKHKT
jgi:hypothetical protein